MKKLKNRLKLSDEPVFIVMLQINFFLFDHEKCVILIFKYFTKGHESYRNAFIQNGILIVFIVYIFKLYSQVKRGGLVLRDKHHQKRNKFVTI